MNHVIVNLYIDCQGGVSPVPGDVPAEERRDDIDRGNVHLCILLLGTCREKEGVRERDKSDESE